ncbi:MAG: protein kinase [Deltaproteobacteria bacterium]|nr:protein kinase [Deltaproteobacteria bacterium]
MKPERFGSYTLLRPLGKGGMAEVFLARTESATGFQKLLAIKRLLPPFCADKQLVTMLGDEARVSVWLTHPNIVQVFDFGRVASTYYIAMEYVDGCDLWRLIRGPDERSARPLPLATALHLMTQVMDALDYAHRRRNDKGEPLKIVHRDVSPHNVIVSREGEVKLADFGLARATISVHHSHAGVIRGKFSYMPREQAQGLDIDHRIDIFAAGAALYEALTGVKPYTAVNLAQQLYQLERPLPPPSSHVPDIPEEIDELCMQALSPDPETRYQSAEEMGNDLKHALAKVSTPGMETQHLAALVRNTVGPPPREVADLGGLSLAEVRPSAESMVDDEVQAVRRTLLSAPDSVEQKVAEASHASVSGRAAALRKGPEEPEEVPTTYYEKSSRGAPRVPSLPGTGEGTAETRKVVPEAKKGAPAEGKKPTGEVKSIAIEPRPNGAEPRKSTAEAKRATPSPRPGDPSVRSAERPKPLTVTRAAAPNDDEDDEDDEDVVEEDSAEDIIAPALPPGEPRATPAAQLSARGVPKPSGRLSSSESRSPSAPKAVIRPDASGPGSHRAARAAGASRSPSGALPVADTLQDPEEAGRQAQEAIDEARTIQRSPDEALAAFRRALTEREQEEKRRQAALRGPRRAVLAAGGALLFALGLGAGYALFHGRERVVCPPGGASGNTPRGVAVGGPPPTDAAAEHGQASRGDGAAPDSSSARGDGSTTDRAVSGGATGPEVKVRPVNAGKRRRPDARPPAGESAKSATGFLEVTTDRPGRVFVDDRQVAARTPLRRLLLTPGTHRVKVYFEKEQTFSPTRIVIIEAGRQASISFGMPNQ